MELEWTRRLSHLPLDGYDARVETRNAQSTLIWILQRGGGRRRKLQYNFTRYLLADLLADLWLICRRREYITLYVQNDSY